MLYLEQLQTAFKLVHNVQTHFFLTCTFSNSNKNIPRWIFILVGWNKSNCRNQAIAFVQKHCIIWHFYCLLVLAEGVIAIRIATGHVRELTNLNLYNPSIMHVPTTPTTLKNPVIGYYPGNKLNNSDNYYCEKHVISCLKNKLIGNVSGFSDILS